MRGTSGAFEQLQQALSTGQLRAADFLTSDRRTGFASGGIVRDSNRDFFLGNGEIHARLADGREVRIEQPAVRRRQGRADLQGRVELGSLLPERVRVELDNLSWDFSDANNPDWTALTGRTSTREVVNNVNVRTDQRMAAEQMLDALRASLETPDIVGRHPFAGLVHGRTASPAITPRPLRLSGDALRTLVRRLLAVHYRLDAYLHQPGPHEIHVRAEMRGDNDIANLMRGAFVEVLDEQQKWSNMAMRIGDTHLLTNAEILMDNEAYLFLCAQTDGQIAERLGQSVAEIVFQFSADGQCMRQYLYPRREYHGIMRDLQVSYERGATKHAMAVWVASHGR